MSEAKSADIPAFATYPMAALVLTISMSTDRVQERLNAGLAKMRDIVNRSDDISTSLMQYTLSATESHGPFALLPSANPTLPELLNHLDAAHSELKLAIQAGTIPADAIKGYLEATRQIALAAVFIDVDAEPTPEQTEVLNYLYQVAQGQD